MFLPLLHITDWRRVDNFSQHAEEVEAMLKKHESEVTNGQPNGK